MVDQSDGPDPQLERAAAESSRIDVVREAGRGLSRARNAGLERAATEWVVFVDDDCVVEADWADRLAEALAKHPDVDLVAGHASEGAVPARDYVAASSLAVERERVLRGRFTHPGIVAFGTSFAVRRSAAQRLGGWDERLGPGIADFPAADDMDFNYRLLAAGGRAFQTPSVRVRHEQWRPPAELPSLYRGYLKAWSGFAAKTLKGGDVLGAVWLWSIAVVDVLDMAASAVTMRSTLRASIAAAKALGLVEGTIRGLRRRW